VPTASWNLWSALLRGKSLGRVRGRRHVRQDREAAGRRWRPSWQVKRRIYCWSSGRCRCVGRPRRCRREDDRRRWRDGDVCPCPSSRAVCRASCGRALGKGWHAQQWWSRAHRRWEARSRNGTRRAPSGRLSC